MDIICQKICKSYTIGKLSRLEILHDCDAVFKSGEITVITGVSGSGKSTLLNIIALSAKPDTGKLTYDETEPFLMTQGEQSRFRRENIGYLPQNLGLIPILTAEENIRLPLLFAGRESNAGGLFETVYDPLEIKDCFEKFPHELSGGQCQRVAVMRAIANEPKVFIADEPTSHLDSENIEKFLSLLFDLKEKGTTIILATHDQRLSACADVLLHIRDGVVGKE